MTSISSGFFPSLSSTTLNNNNNNNASTGTPLNVGGFGVGGVASASSSNNSNNTTWSSGGINNSSHYYANGGENQQQQQPQQQQQQKMDFSSLLSASSSLMKHSNTIVGGGSTTIISNSNAATKSLREIGIASNALAAGNNTTSVSSSSSTTFAQEASAHRLLAREGGGFDSARLGRSARDLEVHASHHGGDTANIFANNHNTYRNTTSTSTTIQDSSSLSTANPNVSSYLQSAHTNLVSSLLQRPSMTSIIQERMLNNWKAERSRAVASIIGTRTLKSTSTTVPPPPSQIRLLSHNHNNNAFAYQNIHNNNGNKTTNGVTMEMMQQHLDCWMNPSSSNWQSLAAVNNNNNVPVAYGNAIQFLRQQQPPPQNNIIGQLQSYLAKQYQTQLSNRVQAAALQGRLLQHQQRTTGLAQDVQHYASMELGLATSNHSTQDVLWRCIYYCLRCGDFQAIQQIIQSTPNHGLDTAVLTILQELWSYTTDNTTSTNHVLSQSTSRHVLKELYFRAKTTKNGNAPNNNSNNMNQHEVLCLALLSLAEPCNDSPIVQTIEDYIYLSIWYGTNETQNKVIADLGSLVQQWGPSHFDNESSNSSNNNNSGWSYVMPLLLCHQFESALTYLARDDHGLLQATHLAIILHQQGISLQDLSTSATTESRPKNFDLIHSLLLAYASKWQTKSPEAALEYLIHIPDADTPQIQSPTITNEQQQTKKKISKAAQQQICRLLIETKAYSTLAGNVTTNGSRDCAGALDRHLSKTAVSSILAQAAENTFREGNVVDAAELLALAGHYSSLMSLLNRQLASLLCITTTNENETDVEKRTFWKNAALNFYNSHIAGGKTHVLQVLEKEDTMELGNTFQLLLNLMAFFDRCHAKEWQSAWELLDSLDLIPKVESQLSLKVESFYPLASEIKQMFHHVVLKAMESLYFQYETIKAEGRNNQSVCSASANQQRLTELRSRARLLVTFAGLIHLNCSADIKARFARMEAFMM